MALTALAFSDVVLDPEFSTDHTTYTARALHGTEQTTVTAIAAVATSLVVITPADADATASGHQVDLTAGADTAVTVSVTDPMGANPQNYTVTVYRDADPVAEISASISKLSYADIAGHARPLTTPASGIQGFVAAEGAFTRYRGIPHYRTWTLTFRSAYSSAASVAQVQRFLETDLHAALAGLDCEPYVLFDGTFPLQQYRTFRIRLASQADW